MMHFLRKIAFHRCISEDPLFDSNMKIRFSSSKAFVTLFIVIMAVPFAGFAANQGQAEHIVVVVWDGMRPDFISREHTPTLYQLAQEGTFFEKHHPVYISTTEVNGTALNTGEHPEHSGIIANVEYRPQIDRTKPIAMEDEASVRQGDLVSNGHYIAVPTLAEIVQHNGFLTTITGTKSIALLLDRAKERSSDNTKASVDFFKGNILPASAMDAMVAANGGEPFPAEITYPNVAQDAWTTKGLVKGLWKNGVPKFSVLWMSDPDYTQHDSSPGSPQALGALESVDRNLAMVLRTLKEKGARDKTDVLVVSDHGFSTVEHSVNVADLLKQAGFNAAKKFSDPQRGDVVVVGLGGSVSLYVIGHDEAIIRKLINFCEKSDFAGVIFSHLAAKGTFPLGLVHVDSTNSPDVLISMRWNAGTNSFGTPGLFVGDTNKKGAHGSLSPYDMHNTLVAAGPDFRSGFRDDLPTGNIDLAPTILWILGLQAPQKMDGRILSEALVNMEATTDKPEQKTVKASDEGEGFQWQQYLKISSIAGTAYFDEGNAIK